MTLGTFGSTLSDELNRLANGGTYRDMNQMVDEALAAKQWANRENINPYSTDTVGVLNEIAGLGTNRQNWLDFNGVCNYIAGTTGLPAAAALRQVYPTTDLLTGVASYYVDATTPTNWGSLGYVYLNGLSGNYLSVPDSAALDITGDIDIRARIAADDWTPAATMEIVTKLATTGNQLSYRLRLATDGTLVLNWSANGSTTTSVASTVATGVSDGAVKWVRATLDVDNGASGKDINFYLSDDGTNWTQLGTTVTTAGTTSIFASTAPVEIGSGDNGVNRFTGKVYRAQILNGIGGTTVLDVNIASNYTSSSFNTFTATTGQTVTVNGVDTLANLGAAGSLLPTTVGSSTAADSNDPKFLDHTGTNYVYLPGVASNNLSVPDSNALDITGDIDIRIQVALDDWTPASACVLLAKWQAGVQQSYEFDLNTNGTLAFYWSSTGTNLLSATSTVANGITDGTARWIRATLDVDNGAGGNDVKFFTSTDGSTWTQLGSTVTTAGTTSIYSGTAAVSIGTSLNGANPSAAKYFRAQIYNGIDGTKVLDVDTSVITAGSATSFTAVTGQTVTINRSTSGRKTVAVTQPTWLFGTDDYMEVNNRWLEHTGSNYLYLPGVAGNYASTPDAAALDITGDIDIRVKVAMDDWTPGTNSALLSKFQAAGNYSYLLFLNTTGTLALQFSLDGTATTTATSTAANTLTDGTTYWVRATRASASGDVIFYTSTDGSSWTQLGTTVTTTTGSLYSGTSILEIGSRIGGTQLPARGKFFRAQVRSGIDGTVAFDANFETSITSLNQTSFTESSTNAATVTINRSGSTYRSAGITAAGYLYPGATNTFSASATNFLDFGVNQSFTVIAAVRSFGNFSGNDHIISKRIDSTNVGWVLLGFNAGRTVGFTLHDGTNNPSVTAIQTTDTLGVLTGVRNTTEDALRIAVLGTLSGPVTDTTTSTLENINNPMRIGTNPSSTFYQADMEFYAGAVFRSALTASQIRQVYNYFANREVYL